MIGVHFRVDSSTFAWALDNGQPYARVDLNPMPESNFSPSQGLWIWPQVSADFKMGYLLHLKYRGSYGCHSRSFRALSYVYIISISILGFMLYIA